MALELWCSSDIGDPGGHFSKHSKYTKSTPFLPWRTWFHVYSMWDLPCQWLRQRAAHSWLGKHRWLPASTPRPSSCSRTSRTPSCLPFELSVVSKVMSQSLYGWLWWWWLAGGIFYREFQTLDSTWSVLLYCMIGRVYVPEPKKAQL